MRGGVCKRIANEATRSTLHVSLLHMLQAHDKGCMELVA